MEDKQETAISQYDLMVRKRYRSRGGWLLETEQGPKLLREYESIRSHFQFENQVKEYLIEQGFEKIDDVLPNTGGELVTELESGEKYVIFNWFPGDECDLKSESCLRLAGENLARLHGAVQGFRQSEEDCQSDINHTEQGSNGNLLEQFLKHNRELKRVNSYMKNKKRKTEFEIYAINCFHGYYEKACEAAQRLEQSSYYQGLSSSDGDICHGDYNYHNLLMNGQDTATVGFEKTGFGIQLLDLTYFMRKTLEKNGWSKQAGELVLEGYDRVQTLSDDQLDFVYIILMYPEKYWKLMNHYFKKKKSWLSAKSLEKLKDVRSLEKKREEFLRR